MIRFVFGALVGACVVAGAGWLWLDHSHDCVRRCGDGTVCFSGRCIARGGPPTVVSHTRPRTR
jgi:hypothetical protein